MFDELNRPLSEIEKAELLAAASKPDHHLSKEGLLLLRRALFQLDQTKAVLGRMMSSVFGRDGDDEPLKYDTWQEAFRDCQRVME